MFSSFTPFRVFRNLSWFHVFLWACLIALMAGSIFNWFYAGFNGDKKWLLYATARMLDGKAVYRDIIEINPPLILFLYAIPVSLYRLTAIGSADEWLTFIALIMGVVSIRLCLRLLAAHPFIAGNKIYTQCALMALLFILGVLPHPTFFADREYLFITLCLPYFFRFLPNMDGASLPRRTRVLIAIMAGIGFCLKPHTIAIWLPIQIFWLLKTRSLRPLFCLENQIFYAIGITYVGIVWLFMPAYFTLILPLAAVSYAAYNAGPMALVMNLSPLVFILLLLLVNFRPRPASNLRNDIYYLLALVIGGYVYTLLNNGWAYTYYPLQTAIVLLSAWLAMEYYTLWQSAPAGKTRQLAYSGMLCVCIGMGLFSLFSVSYFYPSIQHAREVGRISADGDPPVLKAMHTVFENTPGATSFVGYSPSFMHWFNLTEGYHLAFVSRFHSLWMISGFDIPWIAEYVKQSVAEDIANEKPSLVFFDTSPAFQGGLKKIDLLTFFKTNQLFTKTWVAYQSAGTIDTCPPADAYAINCRYSVYKRRQQGF